LRKQVMVHIKVKSLSSCPIIIIVNDRELIEDNHHHEFFKKYVD
jgi:hypothetical protein